MLGMSAAREAIVRGCQPRTKEGTFLGFRAAAAAT